MTVITVDDSGGADYTTIQAAIDAAAVNDEIQVAAGTYVENIVIDKALTLDGAGSGSTIIDASGGASGILLEAGGSSATERLTIKDFTIRDSTGDGIRAEKAGGLSLDHVTLENLVVTGNGDRGFEIHNDTVVSDMEIINCQFVDNTLQGLRSASNVVIDGMVITDSNFDENSYGIYLQGAIENLTISGSSLDDNDAYGLYMSETGPMTNITIEDSSLNGNLFWGFVLFTSDPLGIDGFSITGTSIDYNGLGAWIGADVVSNFSIENSTIVGNNFGSASNYEGIQFAFGTLTNVSIHESTIQDNLGEGVANYATGVVDATNNWWGDGSGPNHSTNPTGLGDAVTDNVIFDPWKTSLIQIQNGNLLIIGSQLKDHIDVKAKNGGLEVKIRSKDLKQDEFIDAATTASLNQIIIDGRGGDDHLTVHKNVGIDALLLGGDGNDHLHGGGGHNLLYGGGGKDDLHGGDLDDVLIGGDDQDKLHGKNGNDLLIGGNVSDDSLAALEAVLADWTDNNILDSALAVLDDLLQDDLNGDLGADLLYEGFGDKLKVKSKEGDSVV